MRSKLVPDLLKELTMRLQWHFVRWPELYVSHRTKRGQVLRLDLSQGLDLRIFIFDEWEPVLSQYMDRSLTDGDIVIDVGANIGYFSSLAAAKIGDAGRVYSIEASPSISETLRLNTVEVFDNVTVIQAAVSNEVSTVKFFLRKDNNRGGSTIMASALRGHSAYVEAEVQCAPLADLMPLEDIIRARVIKIDVEGAEGKVVDGMRDIIPKVSDETEFLIEVNPKILQDNGSSADELLDHFFRCGFRGYLLQNEYNDRFYQTPPTLMLKKVDEWPDDQFDILLSKKSFDG